MRLAKARDARAWSRLFDDHYLNLYRYAYARLGDREEAQDIASQVFVEALQRIDAFVYRGKLVLAWLCGIARNLVADRRRRSERHGRVVSLFEAGEEAYLAAANTDQRSSLGTDDRSLRVARLSHRDHSFDLRDCVILSTFYASKGPRSFGSFGRSSNRFPCAGRRSQSRQGLSLRPGGFGSTKGPMSAAPNPGVRAAAAWSERSC